RTFAQSGVLRDGMGRRIPHLLGRLPANRRRSEQSRVRASQGLIHGPRMSAAACPVRSQAQKAGAHELAKGGTGWRWCKKSGTSGPGWKVGNLMERLLPPFVAQKVGWRLARRIM